MADATCQHPIASWPNEHGEAQVCGAPIPRLDEGPCEQSLPLLGTCGEPTNEHQTADSHAYLGPLASKCEQGHPQEAR